MKTLSTYGSAEEVVFLTVKETETGKESHTDDKHLMLANPKCQVSFSSVSAVFLFQVFFCFQVFFMFQVFFVLGVSFFQVFVFQVS